VFENGHRDSVLSEHKFVLDNLKNTLIDTNLCEIFEFSSQNAEIPEIPEILATQTFLECSVCVCVARMQEDARMPYSHSWSR
jgi:hypothetical protein